MTADKGFVDIIEACRPFAPKPLPTSQRVIAGTIGADAVLAELEAA